MSNLSEAIYAAAVAIFVVIVITYTNQAYKAYKQDVKSSCLYYQITH